MDLFVVNRFLGDDTTAASREEAEEDNLAKLLKKVEERKKKKLLEKQSLAAETRSSTNEDDANINVPPNAAEEEGDKDSNVESDKAHSEERPEKSGRKKKKKSGAKASNLNETSTGDVTEDIIIGSPPVKPTEVQQIKKRKLEDTDSSSNLDSDSETETLETSKSTKTPGEGFTILGNNAFGKKASVRRVLPNWLAKPSVISGKLQQLTTTVDDIPGINADLRRKLRENGITHFFPIQSLVIPWMLSGIGKPRQFWPQDICVSAPTGSGKTLSYVIPVIEALRSRVVPHIRALVVLPVQDLAIQVTKVFKTYCEGTDLKVVLITGKTDFVAEQDEMIYTNFVTGPQSIADIVITTTGRIVDHIRLTPGFSLKHLRFLVIDEADRIMEDIKHDWIANVYNHVNSFSNLTGQRFLTVSALQSQLPPPQKLLFSATLSQDPEQLHAFNLFQPKMFTAVIEPEGGDVGDRGREDLVEKFMVPSELTEKICIVTLKDKPLVLYHLIAVEKCKRILCFADSQTQAHTLALLLTHLGRGEIRVAEISASLDRAAREKIFSQFSEGQIDILVSTDSLARGIDIPTVDYVVCYNVPKYVRNYIHRVGRTARAGRPGMAITLVQSHQEKWFRSMVEGMGELIPLVVDENVISSYADALTDAVEKMNTDLEKEKQSAILENEAQKRGWKSTQHRDKIQKKNFSKRKCGDKEKKETES